MTFSERTDHPVLVIGGGVAGIQAALDLADSNRKVILVERSPSIGGRMAQLDKTFPTNDCSMCILSPKLVEVGRHPKIEMFTLTDVLNLEGRPGNFKVEALQHPRYVDIDKCVACGDCADVCPRKCLSEFDQDLIKHKAIFIPFPQANPLKYVIDEENCTYFNMLKKGKPDKCKRCLDACKAKAVFFEDKVKKLEWNVSSVVLAPGYTTFDAKKISEYGYGIYKDVVTALEFERILSASGPYGGHIQRLSDGKDPKKIAFIQCVGSRDRSNGNPYCSSVCCMYAMKEAVIAKEHSPEVDITIFYMDIRAHGKEFDYYYNNAKTDQGIHFVRSRVAAIDETEPGEDGMVRLKISYDDETEEIGSEDFDMVVLSTGFVPTSESVEMAKRLGLDLNDYDFCSTELLTPLKTSKEGVYVCGAFSEPKDIPETIAQASGAAGIAMQHSVPTMTTEEEPAEDLKKAPASKAEGDVRTGVLVCNCGINIGKVVKVPEVAEYAQKLEGVVVSEEVMYACSQDVQEKIKEMIAEHNLDRLLVASCTPRTHEPLFQETISEAGLNPHMFELVNIREHCSWVHSQEREKATEKAKVLVRKGVTRVSLLEPLEKAKLPIQKSALVIGGGPAGLTAASAMSNLGFHVNLLESTGELGGNLKHIHYLPRGAKPQEFLNKLKSSVEDNQNVDVYLNTDVKDISGHIGHFTTNFTHSQNGGGDAVKATIDDGVIIVATGGNEYQPTEYHYYDSERVLTQREFEAKVVNNGVSAKTVAMVQCVGSRSKEFGWCSRVCCTEAIKNAIMYKEKMPESNIYIFYRDIRTYGFKEDYFEKASELGIKFIRFEEDTPPVLDLADAGKLKLSFKEIITGEELQLEPDLFVLSTGIHPNPTNKPLSEMLKVPLNRDGFFLEAHMKLRPVDFYTDGIFLCGLAHNPKSLDEAVSQAYGAVARASTVLSKDHLRLGGIVASVEEDKCSVCLTCVRACPFQVPVINDRNVAYIELAKCQGCGICVSECPAKAIQLAHFKDFQILAETDSLLVVEEVE